MKQRSANKKTTPNLPARTDWRTTDQQELLKRKLRAEEETYQIKHQKPEHPIYANFAVKSASGVHYTVEIRDLKTGAYSCTCTDFRINCLGTCKHIEGVLLYLQKKTP